MVVLAVMAGLLALVPPMFDHGMSRTDMRSVARQMMAGMRYARSTAVTRREPVSFMLDLDARRYRAGDRPPVGLPPTLELTLTTASSEIQGRGRGSITFFSDGSATGGRLLLTDAGTTQPAIRLEVDWLSGRVSLDD